MMSLFGDFPREMGFPKRKNPRVVHNKEKFLNAVNNHNGRTNVYTSVYSFKGLKENEYGQEYADYDTAVVDKVFFDLDSGESFQKIIKLHEFLSEHDLKHCLIMSGGGFHCYVSCEKYQPEYPRGCVANIQKKIADKAGLSIGEPKLNDIDEHIVGDVSRITRVPNTYNLKRKCFCVPLKSDDLYQFKKIGEIQKKAQEQRLISIQWYGSKLITTSKYDEPNIEEDDYYENVEMGKCDIEDYGDENLWPCVKFMTERHKEWRGNHHKLRYWFAIWLREMGFTKQEAKEICKKYYSKYKRNDGTRNDYNHMVVHDHVFKTIFDNNGTHMFPKCEKLRKEGVCPGKCEHYHGVYLE